MEHASLPMLMFDVTYHVGHMEGRTRQQGRHSYEGAGLSVSLHPDAWRRIGRAQVDGPTWALQACRDGVVRPTELIDMHACLQDGNLRHSVIEWATAEGLLKTQVVFRYDWYDDELGDNFYASFPTLEEALIEADGDEAAVTTVSGVIATPALAEAANQRDITPTLALEHAMLCYLERHSDADGVWWADELDPARLSAPRGATFQSRLDRFIVTNAEPSADENDDLFHHVDHHHLFEPTT